MPLGVYFYLLNRWYPLRFAPLTVYSKPFVFFASVVLLLRGPMKLAEMIPKKSLDTQCPTFSRQPVFTPPDWVFPVV